MAQIQPPETFDFSTPNEWPKWRKRFERYLVVSGMKKKEEADKIDLFMYLMGDRADDIFRTFKFEKEEEATKIDSVLKAFDSHFCVRKNIIYERAKFNSRIQEDREPVDEFITSLYKLADSCEFEGLHEQLIRDRIVVGVRDKALSERMQLDSELTLEKAVKMVRQQEAVRQQQVDLQRPSTSQKVNQSNGMAEAGVKIAKLILKKNQDPSLGLLEYRSTPLENGYSPAELLMGRKLRTTLPIAPENLNPRLVDSQTLKRKEGRRRKDMKSRYDRRCGATDMEELSEGFMVVGVMTGRGVLPLIKVPSKVKVNSEFYIECVLKPVIEQLKDLYPGEMDKVFLHHDKASSHTSNKTQQFLQEMKDTLGLNFIRNSDIPVKSPDASPLDFYGFGMLKQRLFNRCPKTEAGLWKAAQEEWSNVSLSKVKEVFAAWKVRCREIAKKKGKHIEHMKKIHVRKIKF
ncbi:hypothetical protein LAZ67_14001786 [Cordylochernes scorpioides]|uniref:Transposase n=1 Tax=Cordylochernes scorpioides TaxID=51811 RepID=A0ABY6L6D9_9ARAC|nr:hypothetical protein LAZ67_14001786 [Cordylochernes scorpioides]